MIILPFPIYYQTDPIFSGDSAIMKRHLLPEIDVDVQPASQACQILALKGSFVNQTKRE